MIELHTNRPPSGTFAINRASKQARGLIAWWPLAGGLHEYVRNYPIALRQGNATVGTTDMGRAGVFPGAAGDYINTYSYLADGSSYLTVAAWAKTNTLSGGAYNLRYIVSNENGAAGWNIALDTNTDKLQTYLHSGAWRGAVSPTMAIANQWYHVAMVYNIAEPAASQLKLYIDGRFSAQGGSGGTAINTANMTIGIGAVASLTDRPWSGNIRDVRIYNRALKAVEIFALWNPETRYELYQLPALSVRHIVILGTTTVHLTWSDNSEGEDGFSIERATDGGGFTEIDTVTAGVETYDDSPETGHTYTYRVRAISAAKGDSEYSNEAEVTV